MTHSTAGVRGFDHAADGRAVVIAVDGPSGSGKSSAARGVASALGLRYLDTGAMYRALTWWLLEHGVDMADPDAVAAQALVPVVEVSTDPAVQRVTADGIDVTREIRSRRVSNVVSLVAAVPAVRGHLIARQREIIAGAVAAGAGIVAEGRDIGTVVAPEADVKVFLTASEQVRAERRTAELTTRKAADLDDGSSASTALTMAEQQRRDRRDAPQTQVARDAVEIDTTELRLDEVIGRLLDLAATKLAGS